VYQTGAQCFAVQLTSTKDTVRKVDVTTTFGISLLCCLLCQGI
jgi:hypothetical protein